MKLNRIFEQILKETSSLYFRKNPDSDEAYKTIEEGSDIEVGCSVEENGRHYDFIWQRSKSNENLKHGFTHYLTLWAYTDERRFIDGQKAGHKPVELKTDEGNIGMLCALSLERFGFYDDEMDVPAQVLFLVRQEEADNGRIRLISCYATGKQDHIKTYINNFKTRKLYVPNRLDSIDKQNKTDGTVGPITERFLKEIANKQSIMITEAVEDFDDWHIRHFEKGYQIFQNFIRK